MTLSTFNWYHRRFCGATLTVGAADANTNVAATVYSRMVPFQLGVHFDGGEQKLAPAAMLGCDEASVGFNIYYEQFTCWCLDAG